MPKTICNWAGQTLCATTGHKEMTGDWLYQNKRDTPHAKRLLVQFMVFECKSSLQWAAFKVRYDALYNPMDIIFGVEMKWTYISHNCCLKWENKTCNLKTSVVFPGSKNQSSKIHNLTVEAYWYSRWSRSPTVSR